CLEEIAVAAPHCVHEEHRAEHPRRNGGVDLSEFTVAHTTLDDAGDQTQNALDDFATVKAREVGEVAQLRVNEAEQRGEIRRSEKAPIPAYELRERVRRRLLRGGGKLALGALDLGDDGVANDFAKQLFLVREVEIDGALREAGALGDVLETGGSETALAEDGERRIDDLLRSLL